MGIIKKLSATIISQIAAGQVVDRPASVVKELIENSLDAHAHNITIRVENGGKIKIVVQDDGCGMSADDLTISVQPHTTSKISTIEELQQLISFGFRGEALASIGLVGKLSVQSKSQDEAVGTKIVIENGQVVKEIPVGMSVGTIVTLENIFDNMPARKKFLKSDQVEFQAILDTVTQLATAHHTVGFQLFNNGSLVCDYLPTQELIDRVESVFGSSIHTLYLPINFMMSEYKVSGYLGTPQAATQNSQRQILLVNKRPVRNLAVSKTIKRTFGSLLPPAIQPPFVLHIEVDPKIIDINITPKKDQILFTEQELLVEILYVQIKKILEDSNLLYEKNDDDGLLLVADSGMDEPTARALRAVSEPWNVKNYFVDEPVLQIKKLYLIAQTVDGLLLIDQHAAHERILYEEFLQTFTNENKKSVLLKKPAVIKLPILELQLLIDNEEVFKSIGFTFESAGKNAVACTGVPKLLEQRSPQEYIAEVIQDIHDGVPIVELDYQSHRTIAYLACRTAIKAGEVLTPEERKNIVTKLLATTSKYTCPHGRPVMVQMKMQELAQIFHRIPASLKEK